MWSIVRPTQHAPPVLTYINIFRIPKVKLLWLVTCLITLTFDLSNSKWVHGSPVSWGFLPANFQLATPFHSRLSVRHRTHRQWPSRHNAPPNGAGLSYTNVYKAHNVNIKARVPLHWVWVPGCGYPLKTHPLIIIINLPVINWRIYYYYYKEGHVCRG